MPTPAPIAPRAVPRPKRPGRARKYLVAGLLATGAAVAAWKYKSAGYAATPPEAVDIGQAEAPKAGPTGVEVVRPSKGGVERKSVQPGSVHSFETVELYAMASGFLKTQAVDIGSRVAKGQVLAQIDAPRERSVVEENAALLEQARAKIKQMEAGVRSAEAARDTAEAMVAQTESDVDRLLAHRRLAESQYARVKDLSDRHAVDRKLVDEQQRDLEAAIAAENTARLTIRTAKAKLAAAAAEVEQARADVTEARSSVDVAAARLDKAKVNLDYATIVAPFDGVVTRRYFHPGSFVRSAAEGAEIPVLTVSRTDLMRVVVQVPDRDAVLTNQGDPAEVSIDGLDAEPFRGVVSRVGESEDHTTRTMRVEIDLPNEGGLLRVGQYGTVSIGLERSPDRLTVPVACVVERSGRGRGAVRVVRDGRAQLVKVTFGADDGSKVDVGAGLGPDDQVVLRADGAIADGAEVAVKTPEGSKPPGSRG